MPQKPNQITDWQPYLKNLKPNNHKNYRKVLNALNVNVATNDLTHHPNILPQSQMILLVAQLQSINRFQNQIKKVVKSCLNYPLRNVDYEFTEKLISEWKLVEKQIDRAIETKIAFDHLHPGDINNFTNQSCQQLFTDNLDLQDLLNTFKNYQLKYILKFNIQNKKFIKNDYKKYRQIISKLNPYEQRTMIYLIILRRYLNRLKHRLIRRFLISRLQPMDKQLATWLYQTEKIINYQQYQKLIQ